MRAEVLATTNLNNHRGKRGQLETLHAVVDSGAQVIVVQEATWPIALPGFDVHQPRRRDGHVAGEAILVHKEVETRSAGSVLAADGHLSTKDHPLRDRYLVWQQIRTPFGWLWVLDVHRLPRDYPDALRARMDDALRTHTQQGPWVAGGDWNDRLPNAHVVGKHLAGSRIDLWFGSPLVETVARPGRVIPFPDRDDDHPAVLLHLAEAGKS